MVHLPGLAVWLAVVATLPTAAAADIPDEEVVPQVALAIGRPSFSPNGDGVVDVTGALVSVDAAATLTLEAVDAAGATVRTIVAAEPIPAGLTRINWRGLDEGRRVVHDGPYTIRATVADEADAISTAEAIVTVDTTPPSIRWRSIAPQPVQRVAGGVTISFRAEGADRGRLLVTDLLGEVVHRDLWAGLTGTIDRRWDLRTPGGERVPPGPYRVTVIERDAAGNVATSEPRDLRDVHPVEARVLTSVEGAGDLVGLTFDDCVDASAWASILTTLAERGARATFFCPSTRVLAEPDLARRTVLEGHGIGSHGGDHADLTTLSLDQIRARLSRDAAVWWRTARAMTVPFLRPPYGALDTETRLAAGSLGYAWIALWSIDPRDWSLPGAGVIASRALAGVRSGSIVVLHVNDQTAAALPAILRGLRARGLRSVSLFELVSGASSVNPGRVARMPV